MVAATTAKIGMKCVVIQESRVPHEDALYNRVDNILMTRLMGADSRLADQGFDIGIRQSREEALQSVTDAGGIPYAIPAGASIHKYGDLGYAGFAGYPAYGVPSHETNEAIRLAARTEAMITDPVYEGKSMQRMIDIDRKGFFEKDSRVLYAHPGGAPALNGYSYTYRNG